MNCVQRKQRLIEELRQRMDREIAVMAKAAKDAREAATHEESRPENDKDTRGLELAYLAGAQADRALELERASRALLTMTLRAFEPNEAIGLGAWIEVEMDEQRQHYFLAPYGGGQRALIDGLEVQVLTPQSPLGQGLVGKAQGEVVEILMRGKMREIEVCRVQ